MPDTILCAPGVSLRQLLPEARFFGSDDVVVQACTSDSRTCRPGDLFAALVGSRVDGHDYVQDAAGRGATAVLAERYLPIVGVTQCIVSNSRAAFGRICQALAGQPSQRLKVIGVTGSHGKTSVSWLIASVLEAGGYRCGMTGTILNSDTVAVDPSQCTTPQAPVLAEWLARMAAASCTHAVMEVSSRALAQSVVSGIQFDGACVTNVGREHLDFHNTVDNYRRAKARLFKQLVPGGFVVLNADDQVCCQYLAQHEGPALTIGLENEAQLTATLIERQLAEQSFLLQAGNSSVPVRTRIVGDAHISNCLSAAAVGLLYGMELSDIVRGLERLDRIPGRMERLECGQPFGVFVDYARTPEAMAGVLRTLRRLARGRLICVFGAAGESDRSARPALAGEVEAAADLAVVTDDSPLREDPARIRRDILRGFHSLENVVVEADRAKAIHWALQQAAPGDCVLIAGRGHEDHQLIGSFRRWFNDAEVARQWLYEHAVLPQELLSPRNYNVG